MKDQPVFRAADGLALALPALVAIAFLWLVPEPLLCLLACVVWARVLFWVNRRSAKALIENRSLPVWRWVLTVVSGLVLAAVGCLLLLPADVDAAVVAENSADAQQAIDALPPSPVPDLQKTATAADAEFAQRAAAARDGNPDTRSLAASLDVTLRNLQAVEAQLPCEADGRCGSGHVGAREVYGAKLAERDRLKADRDGLLAKIAAAQQQLMDAAHVAQVAGAAADAQLQQARQADDANRMRVRAEHSDTGLLRRVAVLASGAPATSRWVGLAIFVVYGLVDVGVLAAVAWWAGRPPKVPRGTP